MMSHQRRCGALICSGEGWLSSIRLRRPTMEIIVTVCVIALVLLLFYFLVPQKQPRSRVFGPDVEGPAGWFGDTGSHGSGGAHASFSDAGSVAEAPAT